MANEQDGIVWKAGNCIYSSDEDAWDDTELIKAYDRAVAQLKEEGKQSVSSNNQANEDDTRKKRKKKKKAKNANQKWKVGGQCLAIFSEDGLYYEATILSTNYDEKTIKVKFSYYQNEEEVDMKELLPTESKADMEVVSNLVNDNVVVGQQSFEDANTSQDEKRVIDWHVSDICYVFNKKGSYQKAVVNSFISSDICLVTIIKSNHKREVKISQLHSSVPSKDKRSRCKSRSPQYHSNDNPWSLPDFPPHIPPPPPPPMLLPPNSGLPSFPPSLNNKFTPWENCYPDNMNNSFVNSNLPQCPPLPVMSEDVISGNEEAIGNMLMSWYISGFHTGYYQGVQQNSQRSHNTQENNQPKDWKKKARRGWNKI